MRKRTTTMLLIVLVLLLVPSVALAANGTVEAEDAEWNANDAATWNVTSNVTLTNRVEVKGEVTLNLGENTILTAPNGITVNSGNSLTITGSGMLVANENRASGGNHQDSKYGLAGIGSNRVDVGSAGNIVIQSGTIIAYGGDGKNPDGDNRRGGAGIGGSEYSFGGNVTINGGNVTAYGGGNEASGAAGIGGGNGAGGNVTINGGTVRAQGGFCGAAIGSGNAASRNGAQESDLKHTKVTINGGVVSVGTIREDGTVSGDGVIGGDWWPGNVDVTITGGQITGRIGTVNPDPDTGRARATTVKLGWLTKDSDFVDASYPGVTSPNSSLTLTSDWRREDDTEKLTSDEVKAFAEQTKIVPYYVCNVTFDSNNGSAATTQEVVGGTAVAQPTDPTKDGYKFVGWYNGDAAYDFSAAVMSDLSLTAHWAKTYTVTFESNGGSEVAPQIVEDGEQATEPEAPTRDRHRFDGWFADEKLTDLYDFAKTVTADLKLYAKWTQLATLTFDLAGGTLEGKTGKVTVDAGVGDTIKLPAAPTHAGYTFECWKGSEYAAGADYKVTGDHTFTASWTKKETPVTTHTITFDANGGSGKMDPLSAEEGTEVRLTANGFTRPGYAFAGWNTQRNGAGTSYTDESTIELTGDVTLYAQWSKGDYPSPTMSNSRGGTFTSTSEEITYTVYQTVPDYATSLRTWVDLDKVLTLASGEVVVQTDDGTAIGSDVARVTIEGQRVSVTVDDAASLRGKTLKFSYKAKLRSGADLSPYTNAAGNTASVPYQAHTVFDGNEDDVKHSTTEYVNFRVSKSLTGTSTTKTSYSGSPISRTLAHTGDAASLVSVVLTAIAGAGFVYAGRKRR